jgi:aspartyl-tRNA(Asn)/glutamyl-tRNA(Gln) amidotransferase subunit B
MTKYTPIIGLEIHIEPNTKSKMFCACSQDHFGKVPNSQVCPICLGLPGALPFANREAVNKTIKFGLSLGATISNTSKFYRKHYFYPDLPKGFQTSQLDSPLCNGGNLNGFAINHIHLEEDAGKLIHETIDGIKYSLVDFNRGGCALMEMVTEPVFHDLKSVIEFVKELQLIARYLDISNADMEKGSMRLEANISLSPTSGVGFDSPDVIKLPNYKVELKNINSFKFLEKAVNAEIVRQTKALEAGEELIQETRGYDEIKQTTFSQRSKANAHDYRYFPEADLPPLYNHKSLIINLKSQIPELPDIKRKRFVEKYQISKDFADILVLDLARANYFEEACKLDNNYKLIADMMINKKMDETYPEPASLVKRIVEIGSVEYASAESVIESVESVLLENEKAVKDYKSGNGGVIGYLIGMVQKKLSGQGNPQLVREKILEGIQNGG